MHPDHPRQEHGADQRFQRIPQRHPTRDEHGCAGRPIDEESAHSDAGPEASAIQDQRHQRDAGRGPDGRGKPVHRIQGEARLGRGHVEDP